jgi:hypothetical protein
MGQLQLAAVRAFLEAGRRQRMMAAAHVALGRRCFSLGDGHCGTCLFNCSKKLATLLAYSSGKSRSGGRIVANGASYSAMAAERKRSEAH